MLAGIAATVCVLLLTPAIGWAFVSAITLFFVADGLSQGFLATILVTLF
jgi:hypothetical protein